MILGKMHTASQIKKLLMKTVIFSVDTTNAKKTPFMIRPPATIRNSKRKLAPYDVLDANLKMTKFPTHFEKKTHSSKNEWISALVLPHLNFFHDNTPEQLFQLILYKNFVYLLYLIEVHFLPKLKLKSV